MASDKMPGLAIILSKKKPMSGKDDPEPDAPELDAPESDGHSKDETKHAIMESLISAIKDGDVEAALQAFQDLSSLCDDDSEQE